MIGGKPFYQVSEWWIAVFALVAVAGKTIFKIEIPQAFLDSLLNIILITIGGVSGVKAGKKLQ